MPHKDVYLLINLLGEWKNESNLINHVSIGNFLCEHHLRRVDVYSCGVICEGLRI